MGINAFGLLRGLTEDVSGIQAGQADRRELERRARQDLLQERLLNARIEDMGAQSAQRRAQALRPAKMGPLVWADDSNDPSRQVAMRYDEGSGSYQRVPGLSREKTSPIVAPGPGEPIYGTRRTTSGLTAYPLRVGVAPGATPQQPSAPTSPSGAPPPAQGIPTGGGVLRKAAPRGAGSVTQQEVRFAARNALAALDQADSALQQDPNADIYPTSAATLEQAGHVPIIGTAASGFLHAQAQRQMTPTQQRFQQSMDQFLHNYGALLPRGGRSVQILQNLRNSFAPRAGQTDAQVRRQFTQARAALRRQLQTLASGQASTIEGLPTGEDVQEPVAEMPTETSTAPQSNTTASPARGINWSKWHP